MDLRNYYLQSLQVSRMTDLTKYIISHTYNV